jgi:hypothetical protein
MKPVLIVGGIVIVAMGLLDIFDIPVEFPTGSAPVNVAIGASLIAAPFLLARLATGR